MSLSPQFFRSMSQSLRAVALAPLLLGGPAFAAFTGLGFLSDEVHDSMAYAISADGSTVVGTSSYVGADDEIFLSSFRWTAAGGMVELPKSSPDAPASYAYSVSGDGSVIVGMEIQAGGASARAYRLENSVVELLPNLVPTSLGLAEGVSGDGNIVVGGAFDAFRWTEVGGTVALPLQPDEFTSTAYGISGDGSTIVGTADLTSGGFRAFRWTDADGVQPLAIPNAEESSAHAVCTDGSTIVGAFLDQTTQMDVAFAWTELGVVVLSSLSAEEGLINRAYAISGDGMWAAGESGDGRAVVWNTRTGEVIDLQAFLIATGQTGLEGWELEAALGMSEDGLSITGTGINPDGDNEAWLVTLAAIPEPFAAQLWILGAGGLLLRRRRRG